jgi:hypothetical protein
VLEAHERVAPRHVALAAAIARDNRLGVVAAAGGSTLDAFEALWPDVELLVPPEA